MQQAKVNHLLTIWLHHLLDPYLQYVISTFNTCSRGATTARSLTDTDGFAILEISVCHIALPTLLSSQVGTRRRGGGWHEGNGSPWRPLESAHERAHALGQRCLTVGVNEWCAGWNREEANMWARIGFLNFERESQICSNLIRLQTLFSKSWKNGEKFLLIEFDVKINFCLCI
jgi:hypothetical protein